MLMTCNRNDPKMNETTGKCKQAMERGLMRFMTHLPPKINYITEGKIPY